MDLSGDVLTADPLQRFLELELKRLDNDKSSELQKETLKHHRFLSCHEAKSTDNFTKHKDSSSHITTPFNNRAGDKRMVKDESGGYVLVNSRENEKEKLINILSVPKTRHSYPNIKVANKFDSASKINCSNFTTNTREKEKDRLAAIFASSGNQFLKESNQQINKNLNCEEFFDQNQTLYVDNTKTECIKENKPLTFLQNQRNDYHNKNQFRTSEEKSISYQQNCDIPKILVSEYKEKPDATAANNQRMVRIGEFSPLNPSHPAGKPTLGVGEYDDRRRSLLEQQRQEYSDYLQQAHQPTRSPVASGSEHDNNQRLRSVATQTTWEDDADVNRNMTRASRRCSNSPFREEGQHCASPAVRLSPLPKCFEGLSEKEIKEHLYREELRKQIEEKNRIREEMKKKEAEEEAKIEAKILRDQEELKRRYDEEKLHRLELAIKKKEQEDYLRDKLLVEQQKALQENKAKKKQIQNNKATSPNIEPSRNSTRSHQPIQRHNLLSQSLPTACASTALQDVHEVLRQPLLELKDHLPSAQAFRTTLPGGDLPSRNVSALDKPDDPNKVLSVTTSPPIHKTKEVDILVQKAALDPETQRSVSQQTLRQAPPDTSYDVSDTMIEVERMLRQPLLPEPYRVLPAMSPPLLHATVPPLMPSSHPPVNPPRSPPLPTSKRVEMKNTEILEDRWKVPYVERYNAAPADVFTKHNRSVLTQLGAFRKHLQQERLRMQQRVVDETP